MADDDAVTAEAVDVQYLTPEEAAANFAQNANFKALLDIEDDEPAPPKEAEQSKQEDTPEKEEPADEPDDDSEEEEGEEADADDTDQPEAEQEDTPDEDDPEFEIEGTDGTTLTVKASDMAQAWRDREKLNTQQAEIARRTKALEDKEAAIPQQVSERVRERENELAQAIHKWSQGNQVQPPNPDLLDINHEDYDPEQFYAQQARYQRHEADVKRAANQLQGIAQQRQQEMQRYQQEQSQKLVEAWPEIKDESVQAGLYDFLSTQYGLGKEDVDGVQDYRLFLLARDAMKGSKLKSELPKVRAKVKALPPKPARQQARNDKGQYVKSEVKKTRDRLKETGHIDDATKAFMNLNL